MSEDLLISVDFPPGRKYLRTAPSDFNKGDVGFEMKRKRSEIKRNREQKLSDLDKSFSKDLAMGRVALTQYMNSSYMKWDGGY